MSNIAAVSVRQEADYRFVMRFGPGVPELVVDEPPPLGGGAGPDPTQLLAAAVVNCLAASLLFALRKFGQKPEPITGEVSAIVERNAEKRMRVARIAVRLTLGVPAAALENLERVLGQFEEFCTVTQSVRAAIPVEVAVFDSTGAVLK